MNNVSEKLKNLTLVGVSSTLDGMGTNHWIVFNKNTTKQNKM